MKKRLVLMAALAALISTQSRADVDMMAVAARVCNKMAGAARTIAETRDKGHSKQEVKSALRDVEDASTYLGIADQVFDDKKKKPQEFYTSIMGYCMADFIKKMDLK